MGELSLSRLLSFTNRLMCCLHHHGTSCCRWRPWYSCPSTADSWQFANAGVERAVRHGSAIHPAHASQLLLLVFAWSIIVFEDSRRKRIWKTHLAHADTQYSLDITFKTLSDAHAAALMLRTRWHHVIWKTTSENNEVGLTCGVFKFHIWFGFGLVFLTGVLVDIQAASVPWLPIDDWESLPRTRLRRCCCSENVRISPGKQHTNINRKLVDRPHVY